MENGTAAGRLVSEPAEQISVLQLTFLFCDIGRYLENSFVCEFLTLRYAADWHLVTLKCPSVKQTHQIITL